ncbi:hypothetical protein PYW08_016664 [Mythimna loreyi]|uniref:Uncharacterized protein n=1 Tax=Mythimna loreyi TaxID=667449 RepID=A0ACC2QXL8_9NEOP|nr:hypothetical protein PYW08_016664 [Mythimna loreyi]
MSNLFKVWSKFSVACKKSGNVCNFRIMDMPDNLRVDVVNLYIEYFVKQEAVFKAAGVPKSMKALNEVRVNMLEVTKTPGYHTMICCEDNGEEEIKEVIGASMMALLLKGHPEPEWKFETQEIKKLVEMVSTLTAHFDEMKVFNLDRIFSDRGAFVRPEYRGLGIAHEFLKVRRRICQDHGIPIHGGWVSSYGMLRATEKDGWDVVSEISFQDLGRKHGVTFDDENDPPSCLFKIARIVKDN